MYCNNHVGEQTYRDVTWPNDFNNVNVQNQNIIMSTWSGLHWFVYTNGRVTHFEWAIFCWCGRTRKRVQKGNQKKARTGEGRQSAFTRSASFFWPDNGTQFKSVFCLQMQSQNKVGYQICEYTLLLKCLLCLCTMHLAKNHHPFLCYMLVTIWLSYSCPATWSV